MHADARDAGITFVSLPIEVVRTTDRTYVDEARVDFPGYVRRTLAANQTFGGRYNPAGEFGALYAASDEHTAWEGVAARFRREGIPGLPLDMALLHIVIGAGRFVDLTDREVQRLWDVDPTALDAAEPTPAQRDACHAVGRTVRAVADFLRAPSARSDGANVPLFVDRERSGLVMELSTVSHSRPPAHLMQAAREAW